MEWAAERVNEICGLLPADQYDPPPFMRALMASRVEAAFRRCALGMRQGQSGE
jgi:hypothetical protein